MSRGTTRRASSSRCTISSSNRSRTVRDGDALWCVDGKGGLLYLFIVFRLLRLVRVGREERGRKGDADAATSLCVVHARQFLSGRLYLHALMLAGSAPLLLSNNEASSRTCPFSSSSFEFLDPQHKSSDAYRVQLTSPPPGRPTALANSSPPSSSSSSSESLAQPSSTRGPLPAPRTTTR